MLDCREPPNGDFVAFVEKIEREQLTRAMQPHKLPKLSAGGMKTDAKSASATEAKRVLRSLRNEEANGATAGRGALIGIAIGVALIVFGLLAEGGIFLVIVGAVLLWHNLRKFKRGAATMSIKAPLTEEVDRAFGQKMAKPAREKSG